MRAMLIKGTLEEYELVTSEEIQPGFVTSREFVQLIIRTTIPIYMCKNSEDFEDHIKRQFPIFSAETEVISKEYAAYTGQLEIQLDMECEQPRYFVEIDRDSVKYGELILTEEFGYCLLLEVSSSIFDGVIDSISYGSVPHAQSVTNWAIKRYKWVSAMQQPIDQEIKSRASEKTIKTQRTVMDYENAYYQGVFDDAE